MLVTVTSGKGGTGKTLVSTALALAAGRCTFLDLDVEEPNGAIFLRPEIQREIPYTMPVPVVDLEACTFCGACAGACAYNALAVIPDLKRVMVFEELCHSCGVCGFVCPVDGALHEEEREIGRIRVGTAGDIRFVEGRLNVGRPSGVPLIAGITSEEKTMGGLILADSPPGTSCPMVESVKKSDFVLLVTEPTPFGLNDLTLAVEVVNDLRKKAGIIINKDDGNSGAIRSFAKENNLPVLLTIPYSLDIQKTYSRGIPLTEAMPELRETFRRLLKEIGG